MTRCLPAAFYFLMKPSSASANAASDWRSSSHATYYDTWMELFRMTLGAHEVISVSNFYPKLITELISMLIKAFCIWSFRF